MASSRFLLYFLVSVSCFTWVAYAQRVTVLDSEICQRYGQSSAVVGDKVYYDGGWISKTAVKASGDATRQAKLLAIDVSVSWKTSEVPLEQITTAPIQHLTENSVLFSDANFLYQYGYFQDLSSLFKTWAINPMTTNPSWTSVSPRTTGLQMQGNKLMFPVGNAGYTQGGGFGYSVGGSNNGVISFSSSVMQYDLHNQQVANISAGFTSMSKGALVYLPLGTSGSLVSIGGLDFDNNQISPTAIAIFDIGAKRWYNQRATGDYPTSLISGTAVVLTSSDSSSYNIYVTNPLGMFILSIPSFTWYTVHSTGDNAPWLREKPSMNLVGKKQLLLYGGQDGNDCDTQVAYVFDTASLTWKDHFDPNVSDYLVPSIITDRIGGDGRGGASVNGPSSWDDGDLQALFLAQDSRATTTTSNSIATTTSTDRDRNSITVSNSDGESPEETYYGYSPTGDSKPKPILPLPAIVGVSVGGVVFISVAITVFYIYGRHRNPTSEPQVEAMEIVPEGPSELCSNERSIYELHSPTEKKVIPELDSTQ